MITVTPMSLNSRELDVAWTSGPDSFLHELQMECFLLRLQFPPPHSLIRNLLHIYILMIKSGKFSKHMYLFNCAKKQDMKAGHIATPCRGVAI